MAIHQGGLDGLHESAENAPCLFRFLIDTVSGDASMTRSDPRERLRFSHSSGAIGAHRRANDDDLHARVESRGEGVRSPADLLMQERSPCISIGAMLICVACRRETGEAVGNSAIHEENRTSCAWSPGAGCADQYSQ